MRLRMWTYDLAREQAPELDHLRRFCRLSLESGYNALGLYLEHRFAYPSTPWSHGAGAVTPETVRELQRDFPDLKIVPFLNLLGHFEGMLYTEEGSQFAEERFKGLQACPSNPKFVELCGRIVDDALAIFESDIIHIGADETWQLGTCPACSKRVSDCGCEDGKASIYGEHFATLAQRVIDGGRRPAVWGDMFFDHPTALDTLPKSTLIFDWQYFKSPEPTCRLFLDRGFEVVLAPALHTYNAVWMHVPQSEENVRQHAVAAARLGTAGVCVTTWENGLFGNYETLLPAIRASGKMLQDAEELARQDGVPAEARTPEQSLDAYRPLREAPYFLKSYLEEGERHEEWARLMGIELQEAGGMFQFGGIRSSIKCRLLLYSNPFLLWLRDRDQLCGPQGERAYEVAEQAVAMAPDASYRGVAEFAKGAIQFVRHAEAAHRAYADRHPGEALRELAVCRQVFENLTKVARSNHLRIGGSLADVERCIVAREHVERVIRRVKEYGDGVLGYLPSFEMIAHPKFVPHDQAAWWLINRWANE